MGLVLRGVGRIEVGGGVERGGRSREKKKADAVGGVGGRGGGGGSVGWRELGGGVGRVVVEEGGGLGGEASS